MSRQQVSFLSEFRVKTIWIRFAYINIFYFIEYEVAANLKLYLRFIVNKPFALISSSLTFWLPVMVMLTLYHRSAHPVRIYKHLLFYHSGSTVKQSAISEQYGGTQSQ